MSTAQRGKSDETMATEESELPFVFSFVISPLHHSNGHGNDGYLASCYTGFYAPDDGLDSSTFISGVSSQLGGEDS